MSSSLCGAESYNPQAKHQYEMATFATLYKYSNIMADNHIVALAGRQ